MNLLKEIERITESFIHLASYDNYTEKWPEIILDDDFSISMNSSGVIILTLTSETKDGNFTEDFIYLSNKDGKVYFSPEDAIKTLKGAQK